MYTFWRSIPAALLLLLWSTPAPAEIVYQITDVDFEGHIDAVLAPDALAGTGIDVGTWFGGNYSLDRTYGITPFPPGTGGPDNPPGAQLTRPFEMGAFVGDDVYVSATTSIVLDGVYGPGSPYAPPGSFIWEPFQYTLDGSPYHFTMQILFVDENPTRPNDDYLKLTPVTSLDTWDRALFFLLWNPFTNSDPPPNGNYVLAYGSFQLTHVYDSSPPVPEPSVFALVSLVGLVGLTRRRRHMVYTLGLGLICALNVTAREAAGAAYHWDFEAEVYQTYGDPAAISSLAASGFLPGAILSGRFEFAANPGVVFIIPGEEERYDGSGIGLRLDTPVTQFLHAPGANGALLQIDFGSFGTQYYVEARSYDPTSASPYPTTFGLMLKDDSSTVLNSFTPLAEPPALTALSPFDPAQPANDTELFGVYDQGPLTAVFRSRLLRLEAVPEPATAALLLAAASALLVARRR